MTAASATRAGRAAAARLRRGATCTISLPDTLGPLDESNGKRPPVAGATVYTGRCRVKPQAIGDQVVEAGERPISLRTYVVSVPVGDEVFRVDQVVRITACELDPALVGVRLRVVDVAKGSHLTARRLVCEERS